LRAIGQIDASPWILFALGIPSGVGLALVLVSKVAARVRSSDAANGPLGRLRYSRLAGHRSGAPRPGHRGPGLRALPGCGDEGRFWAIIAPFTPDDYFTPCGLLEGRSRTITCDFETIDPIWRHGHRLARRVYGFAFTRATFAIDDPVLNPRGLWFTTDPTPGAWHTIDASASGDH
jgi:hypothetical protein